MTQRFSSFVMFAAMRTGSNFLEANLNALEGVTCHGEVFNPHFIGRLNQTELFGMDLAARDADPLALLTRMRAGTPGLAGFRQFHDHDPRVFEAVMADHACAKIVLTRNPLESYVSWEVARATGQWKLTDARRLRSAKIRFDADGFVDFASAMQVWHRRILDGLQKSGQTAFWIDYDDLQDINVLNGLAAWLGVEARLEALDTKLKKQNPGDVVDLVENPDEMERALVRLDRFNLGREARFEPRRPPAVPSFLAAGPILWMPVRGGPDVQIEGWLAGLGPVQRDFTQRSLRQWKRAFPRHCSLTVLRHPVVRAYRVFAGPLMQGALPEIRVAFQRTMQRRLTDRDATLEGREGFLSFLRFAKMMLSGQTALRPDVHVATQTAILQGFAHFQGPDLVLREERLAEGLAFAAAEAGVPCPPVPATPPPAIPYDAEIEAAAREAYGRDYTGFGYGDWQGPQAF